MTRFVINLIQGVGIWLVAQAFQMDNWHMFMLVFGACLVISTEEAVMKL